MNFDKEKVNVKTEMRWRGMALLFAVLALVFVGAASATPQAMCLGNVPFDGFLHVGDGFYPVIGNICSSGDVTVNGVPADSVGDANLHNFSAVMQNWQNPHAVETGGFDYVATTHRLVAGEELVTEHMYFTPSEEPLNIGHYLVVDGSTSYDVVAIATEGSFESWGYSHFWSWTQQQWLSAAEYNWEHWEEPFTFAYIEQIDPTDDVCLDTARFDGAALMTTHDGNVIGICSSSPPSVNGSVVPYAGDNPRWNYTVQVLEGAMTVSNSATAYTVIYDQAQPSETVWYADMYVTAGTWPVNTLVFTHEGWNYIQATGFGFESSGFTHMHSWANGQLVLGNEWDISGLGQNYLAKQVAAPTPQPTPGPSPTPSPSPEPQDAWNLFMPLVLKSEIVHKCWEETLYPGLPFVSALPEQGITVCSPNSVTLNDGAMQSANTSEYNFVAEEISNGNYALVAGDVSVDLTVGSLAGSESYNDELVKITASAGNPVNVVRMKAVFGYSSVYAINGVAYTLEVKVPGAWSDILRFWNGETWQQEPHYGTVTILGVKNN